jgi:ADP-heptose:LPS heptosyltransferase
MAALIDSAHLFIGNDSGPMHVAIARRRPTIGLIGPGKPRYHNYDTREAVILINQESGHSLHGTEFKNAPCHWNISVTQVYEQAADFLSLGNSSS